MSMFVCRCANRHVTIVGPTPSPLALESHLVPKVKYSSGHLVLVLLLLMWAEESKMSYLLEKVTTLEVPRWQVAIHLCLIELLMWSKAQLAPSTMAVPWAEDHIGIRGHCWPHDLRHPPTLASVRSLTIKDILSLVVFSLLYNGEILLPLL